VNRCVIGDGRETLTQWAAEGVQVQTVVTSPPYWGLRDYGLPPLVWGGEAGCEHAWGETERLRNRANESGSDDGQTGRPRGESQGRSAERGACCLRCSAWRGSLGLEPTPELYVHHLVEVFRLVHEVLREDGTCWINLGDSFQNKQLQGIPWRAAFALQADGWYLRSDIIWSKPNPMPESATDRPTKSHEYLFLLSKSERYYYDAAAIRDPSVQPGRISMATIGHVNKLSGHCKDGLARNGRRPQPETRNRRSVWTIATQPYSEAHFATFPENLVTPCVLAGSRPGDVVLDPFMGSGTVAKVAQDLGRQWLGCELSESYGALVNERSRQQGLMLP
jgi:DNA modification methylase